MSPNFYKYRWIFFIKVKFGIILTLYIMKVSRGKNKVSLYWSYGEACEYTKEKYPERGL